MCTTCVRFHFLRVSGSELRGWDVRSGIACLCEKKEGGEEEGEKPHGGKIVGGRASWDLLGKWPDCFLGEGGSVRTPFPCGKSVEGLARWGDCESASVVERGPGSVKVRFALGFRVVAYGHVGPTFSCVVVRDF